MISHNVYHVYGVIHGVIDNHYQKNTHFSNRNYFHVTRIYCIAGKFGSMAVYVITAKLKFTKSSYFVR